MFARFPLLDPDHFLKACLPIVGKLISPIGGLDLVCRGGRWNQSRHHNWPALQQQTEGVLAPTTSFSSSSAMVLTKTVHEFAMPLLPQVREGEVHVMGIMLMIFTPIALRRCDFPLGLSAVAGNGHWSGAAGMIASSSWRPALRFLGEYPGRRPSQPGVNMRFVASFPRCS